MYIKKDILATLTYFNMFNYPLKKREIYVFLAHPCSLQDFNEALLQLAEEELIFKIGNFYSLFNNYTLAERRSKGNEKATLMMVKATQAAAVIAAFPFVKGVAISGSLSKKFAGDDADIDFFIITAAHRLWLARTFLHLFKKCIFLINLQDAFCMNYFIDEAELSILEKNIYTATEVATLLPLHGSRSFEKFFADNAWTKSYFPNKYMHISSAGEIKKTWLKTGIEKILNNRFGNWLDNFFLMLTAKSWDAKTRRKKKNSKGILMSMHTGKHFSKPHPAHFQKKLLLRYEKSVAEVYEQYEVSLRVNKGSR